MFTKFVTRSFKWLSNPHEFCLIMLIMTPLCMYHSPEQADKPIISKGWNKCNYCSDISNISVKFLHPVYPCVLSTVHWDCEHHNWWINLHEIFSGEVYNGTVQVQVKKNYRELNVSGEVLPSFKTLMLISAHFMLFWELWFLASFVDEMTANISSGISFILGWCSWLPSSHQT